MVTANLFEAPTTLRLYPLMKKIQLGAVQIPEFQRGFQWGDQRCLTLLDSIFRGFPIGSILLWTTRLKALKTRKLPGTQAPPEGEGRTFVLDGLQRLQTLYTALMVAPDEELPSESPRHPVYVNLEAWDEETPFCYLPKKRVPPSCLPLSSLFDSIQLRLFRKRLDLLNSAQLLEERLDELSNSIKDYPVPIIPLNSDDIDVVTRSFVRINSGGKPVDNLSMLRALTGGFTRLDEQLDRVLAELAPLGWGTLDRDVLLSVVKSWFQMDPYSKEMSALSKKLRESTGQTPGALDPLGECLADVCRFLNTIGIKGPAILPYSIQLVILTDIRRELGEGALEHHQQSISAWFWMTAYSEYFTGSTGARVREAKLELLRDLKAGAPVATGQRSSAVTPIQNFRFNSVRTKLFALQLARFLPEVQQEQALLRLGSLGDDAIDVLIPNHSRSIPANRILLAEVAALSEERRNYDPNDETALTNRMAALNDLEGAFVQSLGLTWSLNDPPLESFYPF